MELVRKGPTDLVPYTQDSQEGKDMGMERWEAPESNGAYPYPTWFQVRRQAAWLAERSLVQQGEANLAQDRMTFAHQLVQKAVRLDVNLHALIQAERNSNDNPPRLHDAADELFELWLKIRAGIIDRSYGNG